MRIYLAAPWARRDDARAAKAQFQTAGFTVVSTWTEQQDTENPLQMSLNAQSDEQQLLSAEAIVLLNLCKSEGKATEWGIARQAGKLCVLVGPQEGNIFYHLPGVVQFDSVDEAIQYLTVMRS